MRAYAGAAAYLIAMTMTIVLWNANLGDGWDWAGIAIWGIASILLGAMTGRLPFFLWAFVAIPIAIPFGVQNHYEWSEPLPIAWGAAILSPFAAGLVLLAAAGRLALRRHLIRRPG